jgi:Cd2+/Zn2+-exporting ATPase
MQLDPEHAQLIVRYEPKRVSTEDLDRIAEQVRPILEENLAICPVLAGRVGKEWCDSCAEIADKESLDFDVRAGAVHGLISVTAHEIGIDTTEADKGSAAGSSGGDASGAENSVDDLKEVYLSLEVPHPAKRPFSAVGERLAALGSTLKEWPWEAILTGATFVLMFAALAADHLLEARTLSTVLYGIAYVTGGVFGVKAGLASALSGTIDVDLLMVLAALGAAVVGAPFEGVLLLFLFSLSKQFIHITRPISYL